MAIYIDKYFKAHQDLVWRPDQYFYKGQAQTRRGPELQGHSRPYQGTIQHIIPLLDVIGLGIEKTIIVLPWKSPLDEVLQLRQRPDDVVSLCLQFLEGVAFLHQHNVAHCDLKPGNMVIDTKSESELSPRLFIIDLGLAESVENEETMTEGWCGTSSWIAPELGSRNGPIQRYSPILADRWACWRMIEYFAK
ncbi:kinase-like domain-containing protein [Russula compacta]|nr:kinase-like domain-containing protein [Russula compacta]